MTDAHLCAPDNGRERPRVLFAFVGTVLPARGTMPNRCAFSTTDRRARTCPWKGLENTMATITFREASHTYPGQDHPAVDKLSLKIEDGEFMVLVGPSGCGKSTSLRMLAGLEDVTPGSVWIGDRDVTRLPPMERDIAMVFQNYALYPHMTVVRDGLRPQDAKRPQGRARTSRRSRSGPARSADFLPVSQAQSAVGWTAQRVAMGRAIVREPQVFLMDEPLSNLDAKLRIQTRSQIAALQQKLA